MSDFKWLFDGDSNMVLGGSYIGNAILAITGGTGYVYANSGDTIEDALAKIDAIFVGNTFEKCALNIGTNNVTKRQNKVTGYETDDAMMSTFITNLSLYADKVQSKGTELTLLGTVPRFYYSDSGIGAHLLPLEHDLNKWTKMLYSATRYVAYIKGCKFSNDWDSIVELRYKNSAIDSMGDLTAADSLHLNEYGATTKGTLAASATIPTSLDIVTGDTAGYGWDSTSLINGASVTGNAKYGTLHCATAGDGAILMSFAQCNKFTEVNKHEVVIDGDTSKVDVYMRGYETNIVRDFISIPWIKTSVLYNVNAPFVQCMIVAKEAVDIASVTVKSTLDTVLPKFKFQNDVTDMHLFNVESITDDVVFKTESFGMHKSGHATTGNDFIIVDKDSNYVNTRILYMNLIGGEGEIACPMARSTSVNNKYKILWGSDYPIANAHSMNSDLYAFYNMSNDPRTGIYDAAARQHLLGSSGDSTYIPWTGNELVSGQFHKAIQFDGTNYVAYTSSKRMGGSYGNYGDLGRLDNTLDLSIRYIFELPLAHLNDLSVLISDSVLGLVLAANNGKMAVYSGAWLDVSTLPNIPESTIQDVILTQNAANKKISLYVNGQLIKDWTVASLGTQYIDWWIGSIPHYHNTSYAKVHHISAMQKELNATSVLRLYNDRSLYNSMFTFGSVKPIPNGVKRPQSNISIGITI